MPHEEIVAVERAGTAPEHLIRADQARLTVVEVLEYWRNPRFGTVAAGQYAHHRGLPAAGDRCAGR
jgi:hypothetical protein